MSRLVHTHCLVCEQLCGLEVKVEEGRVTSVRADKNNPYTWRDFCIKGQKSHEMLDHPLRLRAPMRRQGGRYVEASYEEAVDDIAARLKTLIAARGVDAVGGYMGNPLGFSFGAAGFHNGFLAALGTHQRFSVQSIDSNAKHVATGGMFGVEMMALLPDIDATDCALLIGTNPAVSRFNWGGKVPDGWRRLKERARAGADLIVVDPRRTETAADATLHLAPRPESDWALLLGIIQTLFVEGLVAVPSEVEVTGVEELRELAFARPLDWLSEVCGVSAEAIRDASLRFGRAGRGFAFAGTGPALGRNGVIAHWLTLALNVLTDRIDRAGGRFLPAWPSNGARKGLANKSPPAPHSRVRNLPPVAGQHALSELADEILTPGDGQIRALILTGGNPVSTGPDGRRLDQALDALELLVCIDLFQRESHRHADWLIPAVHAFERDEVHVPLHAYNDRPFVQASRQVIPPPTGVRPEWTFYRDLADALGITLFDGVMRDPDALASAMLKPAGITLEQLRAAPHGMTYGERSMGHLFTAFREAGRAIRLCPPDFADTLRRALEDQESGQQLAGSFQMISRRRVGKMNSTLSPMVERDALVHAVEMNTDDAADLSIANDDLVCVFSERSEMTLRARLSSAIRRGTIVLPQGLNSPPLDPAAEPGVALTKNQRNILVTDREVDPLSGVPRLNGATVRVRKISEGAEPHAL